MMREETPYSTLGSLAKLGQQFEQHRTRLANMISRRIDPTLRSRIDVDDILSEAFIVAQRRWPVAQSKFGDNIYPWLYRVTLDSLIEAWRKHSRSKRDVRADFPWPQQSSIQLAHGLIHAGTSPTEAAQRGELRDRLRQIVDLLSERDREILWMRHEDGLTYAEAADILEITENAASVRYVRALKRLKELWNATTNSEDRR